jgi:arylsulfatase A-like enzyme
MNENEHRQVIVIMTDTQRKDTLGCYGNPIGIRHTWTAWPRQGVRFERAYTCQPCVPHSPGGALHRHVAAHQRQLGQLAAAG